jgi:CDP-diacylglycerol--glycerol-3-phosphate 3-phosphatidyltransferase
MPKPPPRAAHLLAAAFNLPNQLTSLRLALAMVMFCMISAQWYMAAFVLFVVAAGTDWLDGYFARKYGQVTTLGRILDPFADKVIICGAFIYLLVPMHNVHVPLSVREWALREWMVVVIVGRELLVTALRSFFEQRDADFSAKMSGKLKMVVQCIAAGATLFYLWYAGPDLATPVPKWIVSTMLISTWAAVVSTAYSGVAYIWVAFKLMRGA